VQDHTVAVGILIDWIEERNGRDALFKYIWLESRSRDRKEPNGARQFNRHD
jgi:hypothetical protein